MATINEMEQQVLSIIKRPDILAQIIPAIQRATLKIHRYNHFYNDIREMSMKFDAAQYVHNLAPSDLFGKTFRKPAYVRVWHYDAASPTHGVAGPFLDLITTDNTQDYFGYTKNDVYYMSGTLLQIRTSAPLEYALIGAYVDPVVAPTNEYNSWIADTFSDAIVYEAASRLATVNGNYNLAAALKEMLNEELGQLMLNAATVEA